MSLVLLDKNATVGGLVQIRYQTDNAAARAVFAKLALTNSIWNKAVPIIEAELSKKLGRSVRLLAGNYVKQRAGVVSGHGTLPLPGYVYLPRKGWDSKTGEFFVWVILK